MAHVIDSARIKSLRPASYKQQVCNSYFLTVVQKESVIRSLPFQGPKKSKFQGPTLPMAHVIDSARIKSLRPVSYKQQVFNIYFLAAVLKESAFMTACGHI